MKFSPILILTTILSFTNLKPVNGQNGGLWQDLPIRCITCNDETSCKSNNPMYHSCPQTTDSCLTIFDENNVVIKRGCYSAYIKHCDENSKNKCYECKSNICNAASSKDEFVKCFDCSTFDNPKCVDVSITSDVPIRECRKSCMSTVIYTDDQKTKFETIRACLDDKEEKDRETCKDGNFCEACDSDFCNGGVYPEHRLKCIHCSGMKECEKPRTSKFCSNIVEDDKCINEYDKYSRKIRSGCLSDLNKEDVNDMLIDNKLLICDGNDCNSVENEPKQNECIRCISNETRECITDPKYAFIPHARCISLPNTKCYSKFNSMVGLVERGCWEHLSREERAKCLDENNPNCKLCTGDATECNRDVFPNDRISCHVCDSITDPNCHHTPKKQEFCFKYKKDDMCVAKYVDGVTTRGCSADIGTCKGLDNYSCQLCSGENCNKANLQYRISSNRNLGMWQDLPLKCKFCQDEYYCSLWTWNASVQCENNNEECVTIFNTKGKVQYRGCSSILSEEKDRDKKIYCDTTPEFCPHCKSNDCNIATSRTDYVKCHYCGWRDYKSCNPDMTPNILFPIRDCYKSCMTTAYEKTEDSSDPVYNVVRTCLDDKEPAQQVECKSNENCKACEADECNSKMLFGDWISCYKCQGSEQCKAPILKLCESYAKNDQCFYLYNDKKEVIKAGCISEFPKTVRKDLIINNKVTICKGSGCNENFPKEQKCLKCDSSVDEKCATEPENLEEKLQTCSLPNSNCYVKVENGANIRGCLSDFGDKIFDCINSEDCQYCNTEECNNQVYPPNRQKCLVCDSANNKDCHSKPSSEKVCPVYLKGQKCVSKYTDGKTERGCSNELQCDEKEEKKCRICEEQNCNTIDLKGLNSSAMIVANTILISILAILRNYIS